MSLIMTLILPDQDPTQMISFHFNYSHVGPCFQYSDIGFRTSTYGFFVGI